MSGSREQILARVRDALAPLSTRAPLPDWDNELVTPPEAASAGWDLFAERFAGVRGRPMVQPAEVARLLSENGWFYGYCDPALWPLFSPHLCGPFRVETEYRRADALRYEFGITRATGAIAETGTIILSDSDTTSRLAALAPWVHVAVVDRTTIVPTLTDALVGHPKDPNIVWVTGPSKTGDIEGILIEGIHGPGIQVALLKG